jgi:hypothetical protein
VAFLYDSLLAVVKLLEGKGKSPRPFDKFQAEGVRKSESLEMGFNGQRLSRFGKVS